MNDKILGTNWILTIPFDDWTPPTEMYKGVKFMCGQKEIGSGGYVHWQVFVSVRKSCRFSWIKKTFNAHRAHCEVVRDKEAAMYYCIKDESRHPDNVIFEFGVLDARGRKPKEGVMVQGAMDVIQEATNKIERRHMIWKAIMELNREHPDWFVTYRMEKVEPFDPKN